MTGIADVARRSNGGSGSVSVTVVHGRSIWFRCRDVRGHWFGDPDRSRFDGPGTTLCVGPGRDPDTEPRASFGELMDHQRRFRMFILR